MELKFKVFGLISCFPLGWTEEVLEFDLEAWIVEASILNFWVRSVRMLGDIKDYFFSSYFTVKILSKLSKMKSGSDLKIKS
jgi:hypothetical protein